VYPLAAEPPLTAPERNRLALREAAATLLYRLQGRMGGSALPDGRSQRSWTAGQRAEAQLLTAHP
jgi:hypothetical protein